MAFRAGRGGARRKREISILFHAESKDRLRRRTTYKKGWTVVRISALSSLFVWSDLQFPNLNQ